MLRISSRLSIDLETRRDPGLLLPPNIFSHAEKDIINAQQHYRKQIMLTYSTAVSEMGETG